VEYACIKRRHKSGMTDNTRIAQESEDHNARLVERAGAADSAY
jgi:hypothetical protein